MSKTDPSVWLMSKHNKSLNFIVWGLPDRLSPFFLSYIWYLIFILIWGLMFLKYSGQYTSLEKKYSFCGLIIILIFIYCHDFMASQSLLHRSKTGNKIFKLKGNQTQIGAQIGVQYFIIENPKQLKDTNFKAEVYGFDSQEKAKKFIKKHKLKVITYDNYLYRWSTKDGDWDDQINKWGDLSVIWTMIGRSTKNVVTIMSTFAFVVASWNMKIFHKIFPWIAISIGTQLLTTLWFKYNSFTERNNFIFYKEKLQMLSCYFAIYTLILFLAFSQKK